MIRKCFTICCSLLLFSLTSASEFELYCDLHSAGKLLECSDMDKFPDGSFEDIEVVNFSQNNFTTLKPYVFYNHNLFNLKMVLLDSNNISYVHVNAFASMPNVTYLDLSDNQLVFLHNNSFNGLESLERLNLKSNKLLGINKEVLGPLLALDTLDLSDNSITRLESSFLKHKFVSHLDLSYNPIQFEDEGAILESFSLHELSLQGCNLTKLPEEAFSRLIELQVLDLSRNNLKVIPKGIFQELVGLKYLDISNNLVTYISVELFHSLSKLDEFHCQENPLDGLRCDQLLAFINSDRNNTKAPEHKPLLKRPLPDVIDAYQRDGRKTPNDRSKTSKKENVESSGQSLELESILYKTLLVAVVVCTVLLIILLVLVCYIKHKVLNSSEEHVYCEIDGTV